jgi:hypothetical protein
MHKLSYKPLIFAAVPYLFEKGVFISQSAKRGRTQFEFFKTALAEIDLTAAGQIFPATLARDRKN